MPTLLILAAGMASRYGSLKQIDKFGPDNECLLEYSIYDAVDAGFTKIVFVIREDFSQEFKEIFEPKLKGKVALDYVYQTSDAYTGNIEVPASRVKPWGTGHAILCAKEVINEPFAVINADDFYGRDAFEKAVAFLNNDCNEKTYAIIGYQLENTLTAHGTVSRGVCMVNDNNNLLSVIERTKIFRQDDVMVYEEDDKIFSIAAAAKASMNFWCFDPSVFVYMEQLFHIFLKEHMHEPKAEFFITLVADTFIKQGGGTIKVIPTASQWFGVTYKDDAPGVRAALRTLIAQGQYPLQLWKKVPANVY
jgi:dTDP-glucose pyrophosphorylase